MRKSIALLALLAVISAASAQQNWKGLTDTTTYLNFKADSLKYGNASGLSSAERTVMLFCSNDTNATGFVNDSCRFLCGYQRGYFVYNSSKKLDTTWRAICWMDTFNMLNTKNKIVPAYTTMSDTGTFQENLTHGMIDTTSVTGYGVLTCPVTPIWAPLIRPVIKGATGNKISGWVKVTSTIERQSAINVRPQ